jgi:hypothetical protein
MVATVKSDLCLCKPEEVVQHRTLVSQSLAGVRLAGYHVLPMLFAKKAVELLSGQAINHISVPNHILALIPKEAFIMVGAHAFLIGPAWEEIAFTLLPQLLTNYSRTIIGNYSEIIPVATSLAFGLQHSDYPLSGQARLMIFSYMHQRYVKNRSCKTIVPLVSHSLHNVIILSSYGLFKSVKDALAITVLRIWLPQLGHNVSYKELLERMDFLNRTQAS